MGLLKTAINLFNRPGFLSGFRKQKYALREGNFRATPRKQLMRPSHLTESNDFRIFLITKFEELSKRTFFLEECSKWKYKSTKYSLVVFSKVVALALSLSFEDFFLKPLISSSNLLLAWWAVFWAMWQGHPKSFTEGIFFWSLTINDLYLPTFTEVLSTPSAIQLANEISCFSNAPLTDWNIPYAVADFLRHMSKKWVTTLSSLSKLQAYLHQIILLLRGLFFLSFDHYYHQ